MAADTNNHWKRRTACLCLLACTWAGDGNRLFANEERHARNVDGIMDNSFLVEEAYNQEKGVVQHILTSFYGLDRQAGGDDEFWNLSFTQEWPLFSQKHQVSYTVPYNLVHSAGRRDHGFGDVLLNYRYQALFNPENLMAFAPRASVILPTGDFRAFMGENTWGTQFNLPFSTALGDSWFLHLNAGLTWLPQAASAQDRDLVHYNLGASVIYALTPEWHAMLEWVAYWNQFGETGLPRSYDFSSLISPGIRKAFNFRNESQLVLGVAVPIGLNASAPDFGVFLYASFEHFLFH